MKRETILERFDNLRVWQRGDRRAVHKPLLILFELGRILRGEPARIDYNILEPKLMSLLEEFGPSGAAKSRHFPFWHLQTDGIWQLHGPEHILNRPPGATPNISELRENHVTGEIVPEIRNALQADTNLLAEVAQRLVSAHFPASIQQDVLNAVGLGCEVTGGEKSEKGRPRDPGFRERVLVAYERRCAVCGYDLRLDTHVIGLEAAHIKWFQAGGPDIEQNGLALCALHHKIFDLGAFTIRPETYEIEFSRHVLGSRQIQERLLAYHGAGLIQPQSEDFLPDDQFLEWHREEVFKKPARD